MMDLKIGVIADDLTGVTDTGSQFAALGLKTIGALGIDLPLDYAAVKILNTQSRCVKPTDAMGLTRKAAKAISVEHPRFVLKKIDTALRGNIGIEVKTILETLDFRMVAFIGAIPKIGRTTVNGIQLYHGVPIQNSILGTDSNNPNPVFTSDIQDLFYSIPKCEIEKVTLQELRSGNYQIDPPRDGLKKIIIFDVETGDDLDKAVKSTLTGSFPFLYVGSLGLAETLGRMVISQSGLYDKESSQNELRDFNYQRVLFASGSPNPNTQKQISYLKSCVGLEFIEAEPIRLLSNPQYSVDLSKKAKKVITQKGKGFLFIKPSTEKVDNLSTSLAESFAKLIKEILVSTNIDALVINGGETAYWVCEMVGIESIEIWGKISEVVAYGKPISHRSKLRLIITKGGSVGETTIFMDILKHLN